MRHKNKVSRGTYTNLKFATERQLTYVVGPGKPKMWQPLDLIRPGRMVAAIFTLQGRPQHSATESVSANPPYQFELRTTEGEVCANSLAWQSPQISRLWSPNRKYSVNYSEKWRQQRSFHSVNLTNQSRIQVENAAKSTVRISTSEIGRGRFAWKPASLPRSIAIIKQLIRSSSWRIPSSGSDSSH